MAAASLGVSPRPVITAAAQSRDSNSGIAAPLAPAKPVMVACVALPVLKPLTEMVTLKLLGL